jgi:hypothetical protein
VHICDVIRAIPALEGMTICGERIYFVILLVMQHMNPAVDERNSIITFKK